MDFFLEESYANRKLTSKHGFYAACSAPLPEGKNEQGFTGAVNMSYSLGLKVVTSAKDL